MLKKLDGFPINLNCGESSLIAKGIWSHGDSLVKCVHCGSTMAVRVNMDFPPFYEYGDVIDINCVDRELERLESHLEHLNRDFARERATGELAFCYLIMIIFYKAKVAEALEAGEVVNKEEVEKWRLKQEKFHRRLEELMQDKPRVGRAGDRYPYPYVFKPPKPPDDLAMAGQGQVRLVVKRKESADKGCCQYCGMKLTKEEQFTHSCREKPE